MDAVLEPPTLCYSDQKSHGLTTTPPQTDIQLTQIKKTYTENNRKHFTTKRLPLNYEDYYLARVWRKK